MSITAEYFKAHMSNSSPQANFGPKCHHDRPTRSNQMCIRAGSRFMLYLLFQISFLMCLQYQNLVIPDSVFKQNYNLFPYESVKHCISVAFNFSINVNLACDFTSLLNFGLL